MYTELTLCPACIQITVITWSLEMERFLGHLVPSLYRCRECKTLEKEKQTFGSWLDKIRQAVMLLDDSLALLARPRVPLLNIISRNINVR